MEPEAIPLPPLPPIDTGFCLPYDLIRYVAGYPESYVQRYAQEYARAAVLAERERLSAPSPEMIAEGWRAAAGTVEWTHDAVRYVWERMFAAAIRSGTAPAQEG